MAVFTSKATGNASATGQTTWNEVGAPADGDTITVNPGHTITQDVNRIYGATTGTPGHAFIVNATNAGAFGTLQVNSGVTLTLRGVDATSNTLGLINQYALFKPLTGSTILGDVPSDYASVILNKGRFEPQTGVVFSVPSGNVSWASKVNSEAKSVFPYDDITKVVSLTFVSPQLANGTQTGIGSFGSFPTGQSSGGGQGIYSSGGFSSAPATEISLAFPATPAQIANVVNSAGKYAVDYDTGTIYIYSTVNTGLTLGYNYYKLDKAAANWKGWGIVSGTTSTNAGNACLIDGCTFQYMGGSTAAGKTVNTFSCSAPIVLCNHKTASASGGGSTTVGYVKNSTFTSCYKYVQLIQCVGTSADPVLVTNNTMYDASGGANIDGINCYASYSQYVKIESNTVNHRGTWVDLSNIVADCPSWSVINNTGMIGIGCVSGNAAGGARTPFPYLNDPDASYAVPNTTAGNRPSSPDLYIAGNTFAGTGEGLTWQAADPRYLCVSGTSGHPCVVENNNISHCHRLGHLIGSYVAFRRNRFGACYHHGFTGNDLDDMYCTDIFFYDNLFYGNRSASANLSCEAVQLGYNHRVVNNNIQIINNTFDGWKAAFCWNDLVDANGPTLSTNVQIANNVIANGAYAFTTYRSATIPWYAHSLECDYNNTYNQGTGYSLGGANGLTNTTNPTAFYQSGNKYNRLTSAQRNIPSVALFDASYTTAQTGRTLAYTVNSLGTDHTLAWGGGTAVQLIYDSGTAAGAGMRTLACTGKSTWTTNLNSIRNKWLWVVSGTGGGQARAISYVSANVAYAVAVGSSGGTGYSAGQYIQVSGGTADTTNARVILKVTSVSSGVVTGLSIVSGGNYSTTPGTTNVATTRITGSSGGSLTVNLSWAPGLLLTPDLTTALDATSVFAIVNPMVTLTDSGGTNTVRAGIGMCDPPDPLGTVTLPNTSQSDTGITVVVANSPTGSPAWVGAVSAATGVAADYQIGGSSAATAVGTAITGVVPAADYFGTAFGSPPSIGFSEYLAAGGVYPFFIDQSHSGGFWDGGY